MADRSQNSSIAIRKEVTSGVFNEPNASDVIVIGDLRITPAPITSELNEYTGTIHRPGEVLVGQTIEVSGKAYLRGPGGTTVPAADAWIPGRLLQAVGFTEVRQASAIGPEAVATGTTTSVTLGAAAAATNDLYRGMFVDLVSALGGTRPRRLAMIQAYSAAKVATLAETLPAAYSSGQYSIPAQLSYQLSPASDPPTLSIVGSVGGKRYQMAGMAPTTFRFNMPTASRDQQEPPNIEFTLSGKIVDVVDDVPLVGTPNVTPPPFRNGKMFVNRVALGGSSFTVDLNAETSFAPNANELDGYETGLLTRTTRRVDMTLNQVANSVIDLAGLAEAQTLLPILGQWGIGSGNSFGMLIPSARIFTPAPDISGPLITNTVQAVIDGANKDIVLAIPFYS